ncbi:shikimate dehydrogenase [Dokdonella soli]|uniref:Shikimate dehydrogenase (NADP(+)) n=1 Tax=Dokdonella soli TaxID=529810 RepID=A0ABN1IG24_9GAMM
MHSRYAVFGQPIAHSLSPRIHTLFAAQFGIALDYRAIEAGREDFVQVLDAFARNGGRGANVTLPLKEDAAALCAECSERARRCGSVNTLLRVGDMWHGDSTDGAGLLRDLREHHDFDPRDQRILLLGAGGAARAAAFAFIDAGAAELVIANRTFERADTLAAAIDAPSRVAARAWTELSIGDGFDLVVNATAAGHAGAAFDLPCDRLASRTFCYDLSYGKAASPFLDWARATGASHVSDGLGMLVEQAAESFAIWHGRRPDTAPVHAELRAQLVAASKK